MLQFCATFGHVRSVTEALWVLADYFTILTNLAVATIFSGIIVSGREAWRSPWLIAGLTLSILLVALVYAFLLRQTDHPQGLHRVANQILHVVVPVLVVLYWLGFVRRGALRPRDPIVFAGFPLLYFLYAMVRGVVQGHYPYPFLNVLQLGWPHTLLNAGLIAVAFILGGYALFILDHGFAVLTRRA